MLILSPFTVAQREALEEIVVRGYKSSIESAQSIKRDASTVVDAITSVEIGQFADDSIAGAIQRIAGVQIEDNFNVIGFWENDMFSPRIAYAYRGDFFRSLAGTAAQTSDAIFTEAQERVDPNLRARILDNLTRAFNGANLTNELHRDFIGHKSTFLNLFERGRTYALTATYQFWQSLFRHSAAIASPGWGRG